MIKKAQISKYLGYVFILVSMIDISAILIDNSLWQTLSKPLIIPSLMAFYMAASRSWNKWYLAALLFSFAGDVLLLDKTNLFLFGLGSFLLTQLLYIYMVSKSIGPTSTYNKIKAFLPFLIFFVVFMTILLPELQGFFIPVVIYGIAISVFGSVSLLKYLSKNNKTNLTLFAGAGLFILSDSMIALNKFQEARSFYPVFIMITYIIAQYLIAVYMIRTESGR